MESSQFLVDKIKGYACSNLFLGLLNFFLWIWNLNLILFDIIATKTFKLFELLVWFIIIIFLHLTFEIWF